MAKDTSRIAAGIINLNGSLQKGSIRVQIFSLQSQSNLVKKRFWDKPDQYIMDKKEFKKEFPDYAYSDEDDYTTWPRLKQISNVSFQVNDYARSNINLWPLKNQASGIYQLVFTVTDEKGDTNSITKYVNLMADQPKTVKLESFVIPVHTIIKPGTEAELMIGIDEPTYVLMEKYKGNVLIDSHWLHLEKGLQSIKVPTSVEDSDFNLQFMMVNKNRVYINNQNIVIEKPNKNLAVRLITFRNILQPGEKEKWKLQVSAPQNEKLAAEMVAGLYDASLDEIAPTQKWNYKFSPTTDNYSQNSNWKINDLVEERESQTLLYNFYNGSLLEYSYEDIILYNSPIEDDNIDNYQLFLAKAKRRLEYTRSERKLEEIYKRNASLVKNGVDVSGIITDNISRRALSMVNILIKGTKIATYSNMMGYFKIRVPLNATLLFTFKEYKSLEFIATQSKIINVSLVSLKTSLNRKGVTGHVSGIKGSIKFTPPVIAPDEQIKEEMKSQDQFNEKEEAPLLSVEQNPSFNSDGRKGAIDLKDGSKVGILHKSGSEPIQTRKNFNETAFFYPQLRTDEKGEIIIDFTIPETLTQWRFKAFAHTKDLMTGYLEKEIVTQKELSISANMPRFFREGDTVTVSARLANLTSTILNGKVQIEFFNALNMYPVSLLVNPSDGQQSFNVGGATNKTISFKLFIPSSLEAITYKLTADADLFSDGEENTLPVLTNSMLVTESMPMMIRPGQERAFTFDKLVNQSSTTLQNKTLTLEYTQNPAWYAIQSLPYMMEFPYECSEQVFSRYYANSLATNLVNHFPVIKQVFDKWKNVNSPELLSNLEKNQDLKATLLEETPWLQNALNESEQKKRVALLFDLNKMSNELGLNLDKLKKKQLESGAFPWFGGSYPDRYITEHILEGIGQLVHLNIVDFKNPDLKSITDNAMNFLDNELIKDANKDKKLKAYEGRELGSMEVHSYFTKSYFVNQYSNKEVQSLQANYLQLAEKQWVRMNVYEQAMVALTMLKNNKPEVVHMIINSLKETAQHSDELGMYWARNQLGYYWYESPIETQSLMIELFNEVGNEQKAVDEMKIWLLRNKQTNDWKTTKATAAACYALLMKSDGWLDGNNTSEIKLGGKSLEVLKPDVKADAGTGYIKTNWKDEQIKPSLGKVDIKNNGKSISWGAIHWQYLENLDKITSANTDIHLERKYFIQKHTDSGPVLTEVDKQHQPKTGDLLKVVIYLKAGREYEYIQLKDMRPSGTEPVDVISTFKYQDGLYYYQVTKDVTTNFFISNMQKGNYVFEYSLRVVQPGNYSTGITSVQCMYAPEFNAHSEGTRLTIKPE